MENDYIVIGFGPSQFHKFRVIASSYQETTVQTQMAELCLNGIWDVAFGPSYELRSMGIRVRAEDSSGFGTYEDLKSYYKSGQPLKLQDHRYPITGKTYRIVITQPLESSIVTTKLLGYNAIYTVQFQYLILEETTWS